MSCASRDGGPGRARHRHFLWDFDGTLFDSYPHSTAALCAAATRFGVPADPEAVSRALRHSFAEAFALLKLGPEALACFRRLHGDPDFPPPIVPFPRAGEVLEALAARGARHYLYTHSARRMSVAYIERFGMGGLFADYMTPEDPDFTRKPDPGAIRALLARHAIPPAEAVMVGDREVDMLCARAAGIDGILVDPDRLVGETCATRRVDRLAALLEDETDPI